jgi:hypothetical protein
MYNKDKYVSNGLLDEQYNPNQIQAQSTTVYRALQSGYAELMGMYPPQYSELDYSYVKSKHLPPMAVRSQLIPDIAYTPIPLYNYLSPNSKAALDQCPYADAQYTDYWLNKPDIIFHDVSL